MPDTNSPMSQEERDVTVSGINPETGEYLTPAERKALFKKQRMGSKINPESFRSGTFSATKKSDGGSGGGAIVKFDLKNTVQSGDIVTVPKEEQKESPTPDETVQEVKVEDLGSTNKEEDSTEFKSILEKLKETFDKILNLKQKQNSVEGKTTTVDEKKSKLFSKKGKKSKKTGGKDVFGIGRKIKSTATKAFGDIFGIFGDVLQFAALNWLSDPKNKETIKSIVNIASQIFKWIDSTVTWGIDTTLTGFSELVGPENPISTRISGFFKLATVFFGLRWLLNPLKIVKDLRRVFKIVGRFGKFVNKTLAKPIKIVQDFVQKALNKILGKTFKGNLFKGVRRFILKVGGKSLFKVFKGLGRGFTKVVSRIPVLGGLLDFALNVFVFKENPSRAAFKAIGATLLGVIGTGFGGPLGAIIGGFAGDWAGGKVYDIFFGGKKGNGDEDTDNNRNDTPTSSGGAKVNISAADMTENQRAALNVLAKYESGAAGYNAVNQIGTKGGRGVQGFAGDITKAPWNKEGRPLTDMTIGEIKQRQYDDRTMTNSQWINAGKLHAVGRYQFIANTLPGVAKRAGIPDNAKFSPEVQDIMALQLMKERGISPWVGPSDKATTSERAIVESARKENLPSATVATGVTQQRSTEPQSRSVADRSSQVVLPSTTPASTPKSTSSGNNGSGMSLEQRNQIFSSVGLDSLVVKQTTASPLPSMSSNFTITQKLRKQSSATVPIIINNMNSSTMSTTTTQLPLNSTSISSTTVLNRL